MGVAFRHENYYAYARAAWEKALAICETPEVISNFSTLSADMGAPDEAIEWCRRAIAKNPDHWQSYWNQSLAELTKRNWAAGWDLYDYRRRLERYDSRPTIKAPYWDGSPVEHLYLHGEQGVGDEIMFASLIPEALQRAQRITVEAHVKLAGLLQQSFPEIAVISDEREATGTYDAKCGIGSLAQWWRRSAADFPGTPYMKPDPQRVEHYRARLRELGQGPYVGVTWVGGTKKTRVEDRSVPLVLYRPILNRYTCVSAQYTISAREEIEAEREQAGLPKIDDAASGDDMHAQAALLRACDAVVTVCQTAVHVAGSVGTPTYVAVPKTPSWRYGIAGDDLPWYSSVRLFRQGEADTWLQVISRIETALRADIQQRRAA